MANQATLINKLGQKQVVDTGSQQAQALFGQGYTLMGAKPTVNPTLPASLTSSTIVGAQAPSTIVPVNNYDSTDVTSLMAGTDVTSKGLESTLNIAGQTTPAETAKTKIQDEFATTAGEIKTAKTAAIKQGQQTYDLEGNTKNVQQIMPQIETLKAEFNAAEIAQEGRKGLAGSIYGRQALIQRQRAVELAGLSAVAQAYQGNITLATDTIEKSVNALYKPQEDYLANLKDQLDFSYKDMDAAEKKKADQLKLVADERLRLIEEEKTNKLDINNLALTAAQNGADTTTTQKIINSKTLGEAIKNSGQYLKTKTGTTWDTFTDTKTGETKIINRATGDVKNIGSYNFGEQVGEINGLPSFDTRSANPGVNRSDRNNNPGNIKATDYSKEFDGVVGVESSPAADSGNFLIFDSPESGINAIGRLLDEAKNYQGVNAEKAIKTYNGYGSYGAKDLGLDPNKDFQSQIEDKGVLSSVARKIAELEGFTGATQVIPSAISGIVELVRTGKLTAKEALNEVSDANKTLLSNELAKVEAEKVVSSYTESMKERTLQSVDELMKQVNNFTTGFGILSKGIPTSSARSFSGQLDTLKANIAFGELTAMREASKSGGALGQVSDREGKLLQSALGSLDQGQSPEQFKAQLEKIKNSINKWKQEVNNYASESGISTVDLTDLNFKFE